jgi:hypothetical protein
MKEILKDSQVIMAFLLVAIALVGYCITRDPNFFTLVGILSSGFYALARGREKPSQTVNAENVESVDNSINDKENKKEVVEFMG